MPTVRLSAAGVDLFNRFAPHWPRWRDVCAYSAARGVTLDWSQLRGSAVGVSRRDPLVAVVWGRLDRGAEFLNRSFVEFDDQ